MQLYKSKLKALCEWVDENPDSEQAEVIRKVIADLDGDGPIGGMLHKLDHDLFTKVTSTLIDFRRQAFMGPYREIHEEARQRVGVEINDHSEQPEGV